MKRFNKLKIFVATPVRHDDVYTPIHVCRANSEYKVEMVDMIGDDTVSNENSITLLKC